MHPPPPMGCTVMVPPAPPPPKGFPGVAGLGGGGVTLDQWLATVAVVVSVIMLGVLPPHPIAKASMAAKPPNAIAVLPL